MEFIYRSENGKYIKTTKSINELYRVGVRLPENLRTGTVVIDTGNSTDQQVYSITANFSDEIKAMTSVDRIVKNVILSSISGFGKIVEVSPAIREVGGNITVSLRTDADNNEEVFDSAEVTNINSIVNPLFLKAYLLFMEMTERPIGVK